MRSDEAVFHCVTYCFSTTNISIFWTFLAKILSWRLENISLSIQTSIQNEAIWLVNFRAKTSRNVFLLFHIRQKLMRFSKIAFSLLDMIQQSISLFFRYHYSFIDSLSIKYIIIVIFAYHDLAVIANDSRAIGRFAWLLASSPVFCIDYKDHAHSSFIGFTSTF